MLITGDLEGASTQERAKWIQFFGNTVWKFAPGVNSRNLLTPKERGYIAVSIIYSPDEERVGDKDPTSDNYFKPQNLRPLQGSVF